MSNKNYYIAIDYYYNKEEMNRFRFKEPFENEQEAMKFANTLAQGAIDDLKQNSPYDRKFSIVNNNKSISILCFILDKDRMVTSVPSIISYTVVQDN